MNNLLESVFSYIVPAAFIFILKDIFDVFLTKKNINTYRIVGIWIIYLFTDHTIRDMTSFSTVISMIYNILCFTILCRMLYIDSYKRIILVSLFVLILGCISEAVIGFIFIIGMGSIEEYELYGSICSKLMLLIILRCIKYFRFYKYSHTYSNKFWVANICLAIGSLFIIDSLYLLNINEQDHGLLGRAMLSAIILLMLNIIAFKTFDLLVKYSEKQKESMIYKQQISSYKMLNVERESALKEMRKYRHDFKNHITCVKVLVENGEYTRCLAYIESIFNLDPANKLPFVGSGNIVVDALLKSKYMIASQYEITIIPTLKIPTEFEFLDCDLCVIIGNALDNAIEALKDSSIASKKIYIEMIMKHSNLIICVKNQYETDLNKDIMGNLYTNKADAQNHGLGLSSIRTVVKKYNGIMEISTDNKEFELSILLYSEK